MPLFSRRIPTLLGGVSQQPPALRDEQQLEEQINGLSHPTFGLLKRPPTQWLAKLTASITGADTAFTLPIETNAKRFILVVRNGTIAVYDRLTGAAVTVDTPNGTGYLATGPFRAVQIGGTTVIVNLGTTILKGTKGAPDKVNEALIVVRQADYGTQYSLTLDTETVGFGSPEGSTPNARFQIDTTIIAGRLKTLIGSVANLSAFTVTQYGSTLHITRSDGADFDLSTDDGLADNGLIVIKGAVQRFTDLPNKARGGMVVEVTGDNTNKFDNYFVQFDVSDTATNDGVWKECVKPGEVVALDASTLPHILEYKGKYLNSLAAEPPPAPKLGTGGGTLTRDYWDDLNVGLVNILTAVGQLHNHGDHFNMTPAAANTLATEYEMFYRVDTRKADPTNAAEIVMQSETGNATNVWVDRDSALYGPEVQASNQRLAATFSLPAGARLRIALRYANGVTPADGARADFFTNPYNNVQYPAVRFTPRTGVTVVYEAQRVYPQGVLYRVTVDGINFDLTPGSDQTGAQIATSLKNLIDAHASYTATTPVPGTILVVKDAGGVATVSASIAWTPATMYHNSSLALTPSALVGKTVKNLTDGSTGTVSANTSTTITLSGALTGGTGNTFARDDEVIVIGSGDYFVFRRPEWAERVVGSVLTNPFPSIVDKKLTEVAYHRGRLVLVCEDSLVCSEADESFNLYRTTVTQLLDGDPIDVRPANAKSIQFHSAVEWNDSLLLWSGRQQYALLGRPLLSPTTVELKLLTEYPSVAVRPVVLGRRVYFPSVRGGFMQVHSYEEVDGEKLPQAVPLTLAIPRYITGNVLHMAGDAESGIFAMLTDANRTKLFINSYDRTIGMNAWSQWQFPAGGTVIGFDVLDGKLAVVVKWSDGIHLEYIDLGVE